MSLEEKKRRVHGKVLPGIGMPENHSALTEAIAQTWNGRESEDELTYKAARLAEKLYREEREQARVEIKAEQRLAETPGDRILADAILRALKPLVEDLRREHFDSPEPPFAGDMAGAALWVEETNRADVERWVADDEKLAALDEIERLKVLHGFDEVRVDQKLGYLPYHRPGEDMYRSVDTCPGTYLRMLAVETRKVARHTGFPQDAFIMHILTGIPPKRSRARITTRENRYTVPGSGEEILTTTASVDISARHLSDKELRLLNAAVSGHIGGRASKPLSDENEVLWNVVEDLGGPPNGHGSKGPFWEAVAKRLEEEPVYHSATTPEAVGKRYGRILERLSAPGQAPPDTLKLIPELERRNAERRAEKRQD